MKYISILLFLFVNLLFTQAQTIQVLGLQDELPIDQVLIYNTSKTHTITSDEDGRADISSFLEKDILIFQHLSYQEYKISKKEIKALNNTIYLEDASESIEEVVLTASRSKESRSRIAEQVEVIGLRKIQEYSPQTSADLLSLTPGVKVQKSQFGGGSPVLRGMEANRILLVVDGVRMNNAIYRKGHLQNSITVSPNLLARAEVLFGPSSIIYGSDALGGVIHYYTKTPRLNDKNTLNSSLFTRYSSINTELSASYTAEYSSKKWASLTAISVAKYADLKMGKNRTHNFKDWGLVPYYSRNTASYYTQNPTKSIDQNYQMNTGFSQMDILQKFFIPLSKQTELNLNFQYSNSTDVPRFDKLNEYSEGSLKYAEWYYGPQKRFLASAQLLLTPRYKYLDNGSITLAYQDINESRNNRKFGELVKSFAEENVKVLSFNADFHVPLVPDQKRILSYGFEASYNDVTSKAYAREISVNEHEIIGFRDAGIVQTRYPDGGSSYSNFAGYSNYRFDHSKTGTLNLGVRFTHTLLQAKWIDDTYIRLPDMEVSLSNSALSGTVGYVYKPNVNWRISAVLSSGFRAPNIDDVGKVREKRGKVSVPNIDLKPEYAYNTEIGIARYFDTRKTRVGFNIYYTLLQNYIARDFFRLNGQDEILYAGEILPTVSNINKGNAFVQGATLSIQSRILKYFKIKSALTYTKGEAYDDDEPLSSIPPLFGNIDLSYSHKKWQFVFDFRFNTKKPAVLYNISEGIDNIEETPIIDATASKKVDKYYGTPAWQTYGIATQYKLSQHATIRLRIKNLFDIHYKEFASGISAGGRDFSLSVNTNF